MGKVIRAHALSYTVGGRSTLTLWDWNGLERTTATRKVVRDFDHERLSCSTATSGPIEGTYRMRPEDPPELQETQQISIFAINHPARHVRVASPVC